MKRKSLADLKGIRKGRSGKSALESIQALVKALEAGSYNAAPSTLSQGAALKVESLDEVWCELKPFDLKAPGVWMKSAEECEGEVEAEGQ